MICPQREKPLIKIVIDLLSIPSLTKDNCPAGTEEISLRGEVTLEGETGLCLCL